MFDEMRHHAPPENFTSHRANGSVSESLISKVGITAVC